MNIFILLVSKKIQSNNFDFLHFSGNLLASGGDGKYMLTQIYIYIYIYICMRMYIYIYIISMYVCV